MASYRPSQQAIARRVYQAVTGRENLLLEAPTGSGKSLAVMFPAVKALATEEQLFFLTSRNAGARAVTTVARQLDPDSKTLSVVELTAKEKICPVPGMPCDPAVCPYAAGYYDRIGVAVDELLARRQVDRAAVTEVAEQYQVCPFELSLDAALWADVISGDYNYIFDPVVKLQRFDGHEGLHLLIDEAHQLSARARDMLGVSLDRRVIRGAKKTAHALMKKRVASVDRALMKLSKSVGEGEHAVTTAADIAAIDRACARFLEVAAAEEVELAGYPELADMYFDVWRWHRSENWYSAAEFAHVLKVAGREVQVQRVCLDPADYLRRIYADHGSVVRFSATVSPLRLYQRLHGLTEGEPERAGNPFTADQALVLIVPDVPTYYRQRDASLPRLIALITEVTAARTGRYLVALPSYAYLQVVSETPLAAWGEVFVQQRGQSNSASEALLDEFARCNKAVLFIVMGGIYGESVDFAEFSLSGVVLVGIGLPPPSLERKLVESYFEASEGDGWGRMVAYTQPALVKNIQAAGRLIRSAQDRGTICLVDARFAAAEVQRFFPGHWHPEITRAAEIKGKLKRFWSMVDGDSVSSPIKEINKDSSLQ